ncbi:MAG TPA: hypothetical protein VF571_08700 [Pyrinomonadaceae bacterium]|jgi:DNA-binding cell septation regulator SpoVG
MSTVIFSLSFLILLALIVYAASRRWREQHSFLPKAGSQNQLRSPRVAALLAPTALDLAKIEREKRHRQHAGQRENLLTWATLVDFSALNNRPIIEDENLFTKNWTKNWNEAVEILTERARSDDDVRRLASFCLDNQFNVNSTIINAFQKIWAASPDLRTTGEMFRLAAAADNADALLDVLNEAEQFYQTGKLIDASSSELSELAENHYWLLSESARLSGAGFILKERLADLRRKEYGICGQNHKPFRF